MNAWLYQMTHAHWDSEDPVQEYVEETRRRVISWPRRRKQRRSRFEAPLPPMRARDALLIAFMPSTLVHDRPILEPGIYGFARLTHDEGKRCYKCRDWDEPAVHFRWDPRVTSVLANDPIPWKACESLIDEIRGRAPQGGTVYLIPRAIWSQLRGLLRDWIGRKGTSEELTPTSRPSSGRHGRGGGEESPEHRAIRKYVQVKDRELFGEGVRPWREEFPFLPGRTGDRADVVLRGPGKTFWVVEVEVRVAQGDPTGLLQAVKYRAMLPVVKPARRVLAALVAQEVAPEIRRLCQSHGVRCIEVGRVW